MLVYWKRDTASKIALFAEYVLLQYLHPRHAHDSVARNWDADQKCLLLSFTALFRKGCKKYGAGCMLACVTLASHAGTTQIQQRGMCLRRWSCSQ